MKIDVVILWVDPNDLKWQEDKKKYENKENSSSKTIDSSNKRYRDWENLKYLFRGIDKFMPWVNNVFFVTCGQKPEWLNENYQKLKLINHNEFMDEKYLPTFNCNPIEINLHRIPGLSEHFIYFNDDMFVLKDTAEKDFFKKGLPCETAVLNALTPSFDNIVSKIWFNDWAIINKYFDRRKSISKNWNKWLNIKYGKEILRTIALSKWKYFLGFKFTHLPTSLLKSTYEEIWNKEFELLDNVSKNKFRNEHDLSQYLMKDWQLAKGTFEPRNINIGTIVNVTDDNVEDTVKIIEKQKYKMVCINDTDNISNFEDTKKRINSAFEKILNKKSNFEK